MSVWTDCTPSRRSWGTKAHDVHMETRRPTTRQHQQVPPSRTAADGPWPPLTVSSELCWAYAVSHCLHAPQTTRRRLVPLLIPRCCHSRHAPLDNAGRHPQALTLGERQRPSLPCRSSQRRAGSHTHLFHGSMLRTMCRHARRLSRGSAA